ncbi:hypothetical protein ES332_A04G120600v1 [Gossypium tomentosum]|uniref:RNase H type-1 domain-containing protein n=1 Tax=Gossypium tomentosum TaxID=34277 RepID=A0A5D2QX85_GOSTO|nr:hypothetical protein ES332_A04G120600v1 [Gossypium tomentosum]
MESLSMLLLILLETLIEENLHSLWLHRNFFVWKSINASYHTIILVEDRFLQDWTEARCIIDCVQQSTTVRMTSNGRWIRPNQDCLKCNVDAMMHATAFIQGFSYLFPFTLDPCMAELLAIQEILLWLKDEHFDNVLIELYCKYAIAALCLSTLNFSEFGVILQDCVMLKSFFQLLPYTGHDELLIRQITSLLE